MREGQTLRKIIKNNGYSISTLAHELGISRTTLYNQLKRDKLPPRFLKKVKKIMGDGLVLSFPKKKQHVKVTKNAFLRGQWHYIRLLQRFVVVMEFAINILGQAKKKSVREEILSFMASLPLDFDID